MGGARPDPAAPTRARTAAPLGDRVVVLVVFLIALALAATAGWQTGRAVGPVVPTGSSPTTSHTH